MIMTSKNRRIHAFKKKLNTQNTYTAPPSCHTKYNYVTAFSFTNPHADSLDTEGKVVLAYEDCRAVCSRTYQTSLSSCKIWWQNCDHVNVGICFECTAGEPGVGCDMCCMWLIVLLLLRTLFRQPPGPFSIHPLSVCTAAHKFYSHCWNPLGS